MTEATNYTPPVSLAVTYTDDTDDRGRFWGIWAFLLNVNCQLISTQSSGLHGD